MKKQTESKTNSQLDKANAALVELSKNVSTSDRTAAKDNWAEVTIVKYLKGRGKELDTAVDMLVFFRKRISEREKVLTD